MSSHSRLISLRDLIGKILSGFLRFFVSILRKLFKTIYQIFDQCLGTLPTLIRAHYIINRKIHKRELDEISDSDVRLALPEQHLREYFELELQRLHKIEEKARSAIIGIAIAISLATPSIVLLARE